MVETSVVIPTYNRADILPRAIDSVLQQTYEDFELLIVDDASEDETASVVERYDDSRIWYIQCEENQGANHARNLGIDRAGGEYVSFLDSDDEFTPRHLDVVIDRIKQTPDCVGGFTAFRRVENGDTIDISPAKSRLISLEDIRRKNIIGGFSAITVEKCVFDSVGMLDEEMQSRQDYEFYLRLLREHQVVGVNEPLLIHYRDEDRISDDVDRIIQGQETLLEKHGNILNTNLTDTYYARAFAYARDNQFASARKWFRRAIREDPTNWLAYYHYAFCFFGAPGFRISKRVKSELRSLF